VSTRLITHWDNPDSIPPVDLASLRRGFIVTSSGEDVSQVISNFFQTPLSLSAPTDNTADVSIEVVYYTKETFRGAAAYYEFISNN
jgi:hypothetical protein